MSQEKFDSLRKNYPVFRYKDFKIECNGKSVLLSHSFEISGLCAFSATNRVSLDGFELANDPQSPLAKKIAFYLGMVEAVSYLKSCCCPVMEVECGQLSDRETDWFKRLYMGGLGEFFHINDINTTFDDFLTINSLKNAPEWQSCSISPVKLRDLSLVPVGGGKDSCVTIELVKEVNRSIAFLTVNSQKARTDTVLAAGFNKDKIINIERKIDPALLELNKQGFLNGHTPFSAVVAFLSYFTAYIIGSPYIVLSNESSAGQGNLEGADVNHQYSKSPEFEKSFCEFADERLSKSIHYFSILRPFNELQIAKRFAAFPAYHKIFRSCNRGSKQNIWCCDCAKCLFVYIILSPFLSEGELTSIFGENLLDKASLDSDFDGLVGFTPLKPFECVGTREEVCLALSLTAQKSGEKLPYLLKKFVSECPSIDSDNADLLRFYGDDSNIPEVFRPAVSEMYNYVSG